MPLDKKSKSVLFICPYPFDIAPGQRFRYEMYLDQLEGYDIEYNIKPFLDEETNRILFKSDVYFKKIIGVIKGLFRRIFLLFSISKHDYIFLFREATPLGPPIIEWIIACVLRKKIIYDFDDAIWLPFKSESNRITNTFKWTNKVGKICKWSHAVIGGNQYLADFARKFNNNVHVIPTIVDTEMVHNKVKNQRTDCVTIGWTGSHSTNKYLKEVLPVLQSLQKKHRVKFIFISSADPGLDDLDYRFLPWNKTSEVDDLLEMNIGIMPLTDDEWAKGKCGFKAIQYQALGIPAVVSPVGVNEKVVLHGKTGFLAISNDDWERNLEKLILSVELRTQMGKEGRAHIVNNYSKRSTINDFIDQFD